jgi:uncharacterized protein YjbI with pentapeptide repeats
LRKILGWLLTGRRPLWTAAGTVVLIILSVVITPIASYATAQPQNATLVAALVALLGILITQIVNTALARTGQRNQQELEDRRARATSLQSYLEQMGELLLNHRLRSSDLSDETDNFRVVGWGGTLLVGSRIGNANPEGGNSRAVAQAQTFAVLEGLDPTRKRYLLQFLYYSALINKDKPVIRLAQANLEKANLSRAILGGANLRQANLRHANLMEANLSWAYLSWADLMEAYLREADLSDADLRHANLMEANLSEADLSEAYLRQADLRQADLIGANLSGAFLHRANLKGANLEGANLHGANNVTQAQLDSATGHATTKLPDYRRRPSSWPD